MPGWVTLDEGIFRIRYGGPATRTRPSDLSLEEARTQSHLLRQYGAHTPETASVLTLKEIASKSRWKYLLMKIFKSFTYVSK